MTLQEILQTFWKLEPQNFELISNRAHKVWRFEAQGQVFYARASKPEIFGESIWSSAAAFLRHAFEAGVPVCEILKSRDSNLIEALEIDGEPRLLQVLCGVPGIELSVELLENPVILEAYGESLGKLHAVTKSLDHTKLEFNHFQEFWKNVQKNVNTDWLEFEYNTISVWLETQDQSQDSGLNHGDFRPGNAFWDGVQVWLIDFDEPVWHWFGNDVARAMLEFTGNLEDRRGKLEVFMKGYRKHHDINFSSSDFAMLSRFRVILMYLWSLEDSGVGNDEYDLKGRILNPVQW